MTQEKPQSGELKTRESRTRKLAYVIDQLKDVFKTPRVIKKFLFLEKRLMEEGKVGEVVRDHPLVVELVGRDGDAAYYRVECADQVFFVKKTGASSGKGGGFNEILTMKKAKQILKDAQINWAEIVDFRLGYTDIAGSYFVSVWRDFLRKNLHNESNRIYSEDKDAWHEWIMSPMIQKAYELFRLLNKTFFDIDLNNVAHDPETGKFFIFDLQLRSKTK